MCSALHEAVILVLIGVTMNYKNLMVASLLFLSGMLFAQEAVKESLVESSQTESYVIDVESAVKMALENQSSLKESKILLDQNKRKYDHSWNNFLPSITAGLSGSESSPLSDLSSGSRSLSTQISAGLSLNFGIGAKLKALKADYENGLLDYEDAVKAIELEIREAFYTLLYKQAQVKLAEESVKNYETQYNQIKIKSQRGLVPEIDLLTSQVNLESSRIELKNTQSDYSSSLIEFMNEIGLTEKNIESVSLKGSLEDYRQLLDYSIDSDNLNELIENSSSIRTIKNQLESAELSRKEAMASYYFPSVNLSLSASPYSYNYSLASQSGSSGSNTFTASVGFSISLDNYIPGSAASDSIADIDDTIKTYELQLEEKRSELKTSIVEKINSIEIAQDSLSNCENNVKLAKKTYELALTAYQNGTKDLTSLQTILASYNDAVLQLNSQQLTLIKGILELKNTLGI